MTRFVGTQHRDEIERDPLVAWRRGVALDALGARLLPARPRGVLRAPHRVFNAMDDQLQLEIARVLNGRAPT